MFLDLNNTYCEIFTIKLVSSNCVFAMAYFSAFGLSSFTCSQQVHSVNHKRVETPVRFFVYIKCYCFVVLYVSTVAGCVCGQGG